MGERETPQAEALAQPTEPGGFLGDIFFGDPENTTRGTHRWGGGDIGWESLPDDALAALAQPGMVGREEIARIICDVEWAGSQPWDRKPQSFRDRYLSYADAILAAQAGGGERTEGWRPIESAPTRGGLILALEQGDVPRIAWAQSGPADDVKWRVLEARPGKSYKIKPTHWMPLPPPPERDGVDSGDTDHG